jgi:acyl carrier protein
MMRNVTPTGISPEPELAARVAGVIARTQKIPAESVTLEKTFEELNIDSLDGINILFALETEFQIDIPDDAAAKIRSVREMVEGVEHLIAAKAASRET